jgi:transposase
VDLSGVAQEPVHAYDRIEIPEIKPDVTRVTLHGGICPCCAKRFRAEPPAGLEPGSPFGPNLRAFAIYLRFTHAISFERLARLMSDLLGLEISEGALVNILNASRPAFARQASLIRARLLGSTILQSDETSVRVGNRTWWTWVFHHDDDCCFVIRPSRGKVE